MNISLESLKEAVQLKENIALLESKLAKVLAGVGGAMVELAETVEGKTKGRKKRSAAVRAKMAASQRARWAKAKGKSATAAPAAKPAKKAKRKLSPEGRARIVAALKKRWAAAKRK